MPPSEKKPRTPRKPRASRSKAAAKPRAKAATKSRAKAPRAVTEPEIDLLKHAKDDSAGAANDLATDARENNQGWSSGLAKYAGWRKDYRDCSVEDFKAGKFDDIKGKIPPADKLDDPTGRGWV